MIDKKPFYDHTDMIYLDGYEISQDAFDDLHWLSDELEMSEGETLEMLIHDAVVRRRKRIIIREGRNE